MKEVNPFEQFDGPLVYAGIMFLLNLVMFMIFGSVYFRNPTNSMLIDTILSDMLIFTCFNFHPLGMLVGRIRGVS
jgi:ABC-type transport system involved in multi-copper enzyme maturation permease subunit